MDKNCTTCEYKRALMTTEHPCNVCRGYNYWMSIMDKQCTHPCSKDERQCAFSCPLENGQCFVCGYSEQKPKRHPHADLIIAWANNPQLEVQFRGGGHQSNCWFPMCRSNPDWSHSEVRIKSEPKPDIARTIVVDASISDVHPHQHIRCTFDGETRKLKKVEIIS